MNGQEAISKARQLIIDLFTNEITDLGLEEVAYDRRSKQWLIGFSFARPWDKEDEQIGSRGERATRAHKVVHISDRDSAVIALTGKPKTESKTQCKPRPDSCNACRIGESEDETRRRNIWGTWRGWPDSLKSLLRIFVLYPAAGMSAAAALLLPIWGATVPDEVQSFAIPTGFLLGVISGSVLEGRRWQNRTSRCQTT